MNYPLILEYVEVIQLDATITIPSTATITYGQRWLSASTLQRAKPFSIKDFIIGC